MDFKNEITLVGIMGSNSLPLMTNVKKSYRSGAEIDYKKKIKSVTLSGNLTYFYCRINSDSGTFIPVLTPDLICNQDITYDYNKNVSATASIRYISKRFLDLENTSSIDGYYNIDLRLNFIINKSTEFSLGANNINRGLKNVAYSNGYLDVYDNMNPKYFVEAPINFFGSLKINF